MLSLPPCPERFTARKAAILEQLARPDDDYTDASPKGAVDEGVRPLLDVINKLDGFVTTSSCAGRVAVFLEGRKSGRGVANDTTSAAGDREEKEQQETGRAAPKATIASSGGKGGGGKWLFVSHDPLVTGADDAATPPPYSSYNETDWTSVFGLTKEGPEDEDEDEGEAGRSNNDGSAERLVHFKFEPMILHVLTASLAHAQLLLRCASMAGFRESGAVSIVPPPVPAGALKTDVSGADREGDADPAADSNPTMPIVAVRSMGLALASVIGVQHNDGNSDGNAARCIVTPKYLARLVRVVDERFAVNRTRTERFRANLVAAIEKEHAGSLVMPASASKKKAGTEWEDAEARRARKREEGLRRRAEMKKEPLAEGQIPHSDGGANV